MKKLHTTSSNDWWRAVTTTINNGLYALYCHVSDISLLFSMRHAAARGMRRTPVCMRLAYRRGRHPHFGVSATRAAGVSFCPDAFAGFCGHAARRVFRRHTDCLRSACGHARHGISASGLDGLVRYSLWLNGDICRTCPQVWLSDVGACRSQCRSSQRHEYYHPLPPHCGHRQPRRLCRRC